eukprot:2551934-Amphidinium_carterae.1
MGIGQRAPVILHSLAKKRIGFSTQYAAYGDFINGWKSTSWHLCQTRWKASGSVGESKWSDSTVLTPMSKQMATPTM